MEVLGHGGMRNVNIFSPYSMLGLRSENLQVNCVLLLRIYLARIFLEINSKAFMKENSV